MTNPQPESHKEMSDIVADDLVLEAQPRSTQPRHSIPKDNSASDAPEVLFEPLPSPRKHRHKHHNTTDSAHQKPKKKHPVRTALLIAAMSLLGIVVVAVGTVAVLQARGRAALLATENMTIDIPEDVAADTDITVTDNGRTVTYNGNTYVFNESRTNILCMGVDKDDMGLEGGVVGTGGQADTIVVLSIDTATGQVDTLAISRDTIVDVDLYTASGEYYGVDNTQICLAYAYGDGRETSCENVVRSASRVLYGIPINTYFAIDLDTISVLNDAIGGVEVTLLEDFVRSDGSYCAAGQTITLHGKEAQRYVQNRDTSKLDSNNARMERQKQYITAFFSQTLAATKNDLQVPLTLYNTVKEECVSTLSPSKITYLATTLVQHDSSLTFSKVPGTVVQSTEDGYAEYIVDDKALYEQVLQIFYTKQ